MQEEFQAGTPPSADPPTPGPGIDPLDAVAAIAGPRESAAGAAPEPRPPSDGLVVETRVSVTGDPDAGQDAGKLDGEYGEFEWPEGYVADPEALARFTPLAKKLGLSRNAAQELAGLYAELDRGRNQAQAEFIARNNAEWLREIRAHPEFGGRRLAEAGEGVASVLRRYGSPLLVAQIRQMNVQNWPEMFYFLARLSRAVSEDRSPAGGGGGAAVKSTAQLLFPGLE